MKEKTQGALAIFLTYVIWGLNPVYWNALASVDLTEILAHRAVWSCLLGFLLVVICRKTPAIVSLFRSNRRPLGTLVLSSVAITANWSLYIWAVTNGKVLESSLGYFMIPLVSILFGAVVFKENLSKIHWLAIGIAAAGVCVEVVALGQLPLTSLGLAFSFGAYGLLKKLSAVDSIVSLTVETLFLTPFALAWLVWRQYSGFAHFPYETWTTLLLFGTGLITSVPLILFTWGVQRSAMTTVGLIQYTSPILLFVTATVIYHEPVPPARLLSFVLTWISIVVFTAESFRGAKKPAGRDGPGK